MWKIQHHFSPYYQYYSLKCFINPNANVAKTRTSIIALYCFHFLDDKESTVDHVGTSLRSFKEEQRCSVSMIVRMVIPVVDIALWVSGRVLNIACVWLSNAVSLWWGGCVVDIYTKCPVSWKFKSMLCWCCWEGSVGFCSLMGDQLIKTRKLFFITFSVM